MQAAGRFFANAAMKDRRATPSAVVSTVLSFIVLSVLLCVVNWAQLTSTHFETGDAAANTLLVLDAKNGSLLVGNYSRVGFNHPGPAILYVLAFGEWLFHDVLHWTASAASGQLVMVALYGAFWIVIARTQLCALTRSSTAATNMLALFLVAALASNAVLLTSAWFPDLYVLPFTVFLLAAARLVSGDGRSLHVLALAVGVLLNGHVAFAALLPIVLLSGIVANEWMFRKTDPERCIVRIRFLVSHRVALIGAAAIVIGFLVPLAIETARHFPGPVADYVGFGAKNHKHRILQAIGYVAHYWTVPATLLAALAWFLLRRPAFRADREEWIRLRAIGATLSAATVATMVYARYGVDQLDQPYIALFYQSVPALAVALLALPAERLVAIRHRRPVAILVVLVAFGCGVMLVQRASDREGVTIDGVPRAYEIVRAQAAATPLVLELDPAVDFAAVWPSLVSIAAYGKRLGAVPFCIDRGWHILFTKAVRCSATQVERGRHLLVRTRETGVAHGLASAFSYDDVGFFAFAPPRLVDRGPFTISADGAAIEDYYVADGWGLLDRDFIRSESLAPTLSVYVPADFSGTLSFDIGVLKSDDPGRETVDVGVGGRVVRSVVLTEAMDRANVPLEIDHPEAGRVDVTFHLAKSGSAHPQDVTHLLLYGITATSKARTVP